MGDHVGPSVVRITPPGPISPAELEQVLRKNELYHQARTGGQRALLSYRDLTGAQLAGRDLSDADLSAAFLCDANLEGANLNGAILFGCNLSRANLRGASLIRADLRGACLREADMTGANLFDCDLRDGRLARKTRSGEIEYIAVEPDSTVLVNTALVDVEAADMTGALTKSVISPGSTCARSRAVCRGANSRRWSASMPCSMS